MNLHWYAIYTKHNAEQALQACILNYSQRNALNYETYLPLYEEVKKWRDRIKIKKVPYFRNYLFVKHDDNAFYKIKTMKGFCNYIRCGSTPSTIPHQQMDIIKKVVDHPTGEYCQASKLIKGKKVKVCCGALAGVEGILLENKSNNTLAIEVKSLQLCLNVQVAVTDVVLI
ncbi:MAG: UpxY family transcription antiterminator [Colwellia sp.]|nr:UpxY family transcription antiterminator [Colwellia sp.]